jgi:hypothetical protein
MPIMSYSKRIRNAWGEAWKYKNFRIQALITLVLIIGIGRFFPFYFNYLEARDGTPLSDPLLDMIPAKDVSWMVFFCLYSGALITILCNLVHPKNFVLAFQTYAFVTIMRIISLYFVHLDPPAGYIELKEPVLSSFFTTDGKICSKDLFFSGHLSSILAAYYSVSQRQYKSILLVISVMVGLLVLVQHVHYTIDVIVAPPLTWLCYRFSRYTCLKNVFIR